MIVSHDLHLVSKHVDHVLCLRDGHLHSAGEPSMIMSPEILKAVFGSDKVILTHQHGV
jgi:ABC-type cobalamin/Fe3+-siderophores transport system ATPase subunit